MKHKRKMIASILEIAVGAVLVAANFLTDLDSYWSGMGSALIVVGLIFLLRELKYRKNPAYKEQVDTAMGDERNRFLGMKTWSWTGYATVIILAVGSIAGKIAGYADVSKLLSGIVCLMMVLYWLFYLFLSRKY